MDKKAFIEWFNPAFDESANFHSGSNNRTFTETEKTNFAEKVFALLEEQKKPDVAKLTLTLISAHKKFTSFQERAEYVANTI